ncbi:restriction endonuclease subunit S [Macrococcus equi]|uniref:restriction endonuclease subunit S n=1 Tax=Macrococcus equi TaxID=3395462 RepID=UPI0039BEC5F8
MNLSELVDVVPGTNLSRVKGNPNDNKFLVYNQQGFLDDLNRVEENLVEYKSTFISDPSKVLFVNPGDLVFNLSTQEAAIVQNRGIKEMVVLPNNYCKLVITSDEITVEFLEYWLNKAPKALEQYQLLATGSLKKLAVKHILTIEIEFPPLEIQQISAQIWEDQRRLSYLIGVKDRIQADMLAQQVFFAQKARG